MLNTKARGRAGGTGWGSDQDRWVKTALLLSLAMGVSLAVIAVVKGCSWVTGGGGPAWMDLSASTNTDGAVRILTPGAP